MSGGADQPPTITVNGQPRPLPSGGSLEALLDDAGLAGRPLAVEVDGVVVPRSRLADVRLCGGERIEIVTFVGGG